MHSLLERQLKRYCGALEPMPKPWQAFLAAVDEAYVQFDEDRGLLERTLELSSQELLQANSELRAVFQALPDQFFRLDAEDAIREYQAGRSEDRAQAREDMVGKRMPDVLPQPVGQQFREAIQQIRRTKSMTSLEYAVTLHDQPHVFEARLVPFLERQILVMVRDVTERKQIEEGLRVREQHLRRQNDVLVALTRMRVTCEDDFTETLRGITEAAAETLEIERASVWLYTNDRAAIRCVDLYERSAARHSDGLELRAVNYPTYFSALDTERTLVAHDAQTDLRTSEFTKDYLAPLGIGAMLDAPIRLSGRMLGVVCHEHVGPPRRWLLEEQHFAGSIADVVSLAIESSERRKAEQSLQAKLQELEALNRVMLGREERILELKEELKALRARLAPGSSASQI